MFIYENSIQLSYALPAQPPEQEATQPPEPHPEYIAEDKANAGFGIYPSLFSNELIFD